MEFVGGGHGELGQPAIDPLRQSVAEKLGFPFSGFMLFADCRGFAALLFPKQRLNWSARPHCLDFFPREQQSEPVAPNRSFIYAKVLRNLAIRSSGSHTDLNPEQAILPCQAGLVTGFG
jgi:hypothetical protein